MLQVITLFSGVGWEIHDNQIPGMNQVGISSSPALTEDFCTACFKKDGDRGERVLLLWGPSYTITLSIASPAPLVFCTWSPPWPDCMLS